MIHQLLKTQLFKMVQLGWFLPFDLSSYFANPVKSTEKMEKKLLENQDTMISILNGVNQRKKIC